MARKSKPRVFIETSAYIRFLTGDDTKKQALVIELFKQIEMGEVRAVTSNIVWLEIVYVLTKLYKFPRLKVAKVISELQDMRSLVTIEKTNTQAALALWRESRLPYGDCVIATQIPGHAELVTFDNDFNKIPGLELYTF